MCLKGRIRARERDVEELRSENKGSGRRKEEGGGGGGEEGASTRVVEDLGQWTAN